MNLIVLFALLGLVFGGVRGLLVGALLGVAAGAVGRLLLQPRLASMQAQFLESTFAVMGALSKADNVVTREEIRTAERMFHMLRLTPEQRTAAKAAFNRGKSPEFDLDAEVDRLAAAARGRPFLLQLFLQAEIGAVAADGTVHPAEHAMLVRIARRLGFGERDVAQIEALLRAASYRMGEGRTWGGGYAGGDAGAGAGSGDAGRPSRSAALADAYAALGVAPDAAEADIKRAYRRLISRNHPDKLASRGLPDAMREIAEEKTRELNAAYDLIKEARGFV